MFVARRISNAFRLSDFRQNEWILPQRKNRKKKLEKNNCFFCAAFLVYVARARAHALTNIIADIFSARKKIVFTWPVGQRNEYCRRRRCLACFGMRRFFHSSLALHIYSIVFSLKTIRKPLVPVSNVAPKLRRMKIDRIVVRWATHWNRQSSANITDCKQFLLHFADSFCVHRNNLYAVEGSSRKQVANDAHFSISASRNLSYINSLLLYCGQHYSYIRFDFLSN